MVAFRDGYVISQSVNTHTGEIDVLLIAIDKDEYPSIIVGLKQGTDLVKKATEAIEQIDTKEYYSEFIKHRF